MAAAMPSAATTVPSAATTVPPATMRAAATPAATPRASSAAKAAAVEKSKPVIGGSVTRISVVIREGCTAIARQVVVSSRALIGVLRRRALGYR